MTVEIIQGDCREVMAGMEAETVQCCVTSVPFWAVRDYELEPTIWGGDPDCQHDFDVRVIDKSKPGMSGSGLTNAGASQATSNRFIAEHGFCRRCNAWRGQLGHEPEPWLYTEHISECLAGVWRLLRPDGLAWVNVGDCYATRVQGRSAAATKAAGGDDRTFRDKPFDSTGFDLKNKDLAMIPARVALALQANGWWLRSMVPHLKHNAMPDSAKDRPGARVEYWFLLAKSERPFYDHVAVCRHLSTDPREHYPERARITGRGEQAASRAALGSPQQDKSGGFPPGGAGRGWRDSDPFLDGLLWFENAASPHGLISDVDGEPLALEVNTQPYPEAHYATFAQRLIEPLIKAGSSEKGCCSECRCPWVRQQIVSYETGGPRHGKNARALRFGGNDRQHSQPYKTRHIKTTGWRPSCKCDDNSLSEPIPCIVLDPFAGAGTVGVVAARLGCDVILIDQKDDYCRQAKARCKAAAATVDTQVGDVPPGPLFAEVGL